MVRTITLGKKYKDKIHGWEGVAMAHIKYLTGCDRIGLQKMVKDELKEQYFDVTQLEAVKEVKPPKIKKETKPTTGRRTGGPNLVDPGKTEGGLR